MLPDSQIAKKLTIEKTKMSYNITHGVSLYFHNHAEQLVSNAKYIVCFDESLNELFKRSKWKFVFDCGI